MLIEMGNLDTLLSAAEVAQIADNAAEIHLEMAVARAINGNANVGVTCTQWSGELTDVLIDKLKGLGYTVENKKDAYSKDIPNMYIIRSR